MDEELKAAKQVNEALKILGDDSLSLIELDEKRLTVEELQNRAIDIEMFYNRYMRDVLALKELEWLRSLGTNAENASQLVWHRGAIHCLQEMRNWFEEQVKLSQSRFDKGESQPEGAIISPVGKI